MSHQNPNITDSLKVSPREHYSSQRTPQKTPLRTPRGSPENKDNQVSIMVSESQRQDSENSQMNESQNQTIGLSYEKKYPQKLVQRQKQQVIKDKPAYLKLKIQENLQKEKELKKLKKMTTNFNEMELQSKQETLLSTERMRLELFHKQHELHQKASKLVHSKKKINLSKEQQFLKKINFLQIDGYFIDLKPELKDLNMLSTKKDIIELKRLREIEKQAQIDKQQYIENQKYKLDDDFKNEFNPNLDLLDVAKKQKKKYDKKIMEIKMKRDEKQLEKEEERAREKLFSQINSGNPYSDIQKIHSQHQNNQESLIDNFEKDKKQESDYSEVYSETDEEEEAKLSEKEKLMKQKFKTVNLLLKQIKKQGGYKNQFENFTELEKNEDRKFFLNLDKYIDEIEAQEAQKREKYKLLKNSEHLLKDQDSKIYEQLVSQNICVVQEQIQKIENSLKEKYKVLDLLQEKDDKNEQSIENPFGLGDYSDISQYEKAYTQKADRLREMAARLNKETFQHKWQKKQQQQEQQNLKQKLELMKLMNKNKDINEKINKLFVFQNKDTSKVKAKIDTNNSNYYKIFYGKKSKKSLITPYTIKEFFNGQQVDKDKQALEKDSSPRTIQQNFERNHQSMVLEKQNLFHLNSFSKKSLALQPSSKSLVGTPKSNGGAQTNTTLQGQISPSFMKLQTLQQQQQQPYMDVREESVSEESSCSNTSNNNNKNNFNIMNRNSSLPTFNLQNKNYQTKPSESRKFIESDSQKYHLPSIQPEKQQQKKPLSKTQAEQDSSNQSKNSTYMYNYNPLNRVSSFISIIDTHRDEKDKTKQQLKQLTSSNSTFLTQDQNEITQNNQSNLSNNHSKYISISNFQSPRILQQQILQQQKKMNNIPENNKSVMENNNNNNNNVNNSNTNMSQSQQPQQNRSMLIKKRSTLGRVSMISQMSEQQKERKQRQQQALNLIKNIDNERKMNVLEKDVLKAQTQEIQQSFQHFAVKHQINQKERHKFKYLYDVDINNKYEQLKNSIIGSKKMQDQIRNNYNKVPL